MKRLSARRNNNEEGAIIILSVLFMVVMIVACALALDIGTQAKDRRDIHKIADLASLDASRVLDDQNPCVDSNLLTTWVTDAATQSAARNGFAVPAAGHSLTVETGNLDANGVFAPAASCSSSSVKVTVAKVTDYEFLPGSQNQTVSAIGGQKPGPATQPDNGQFTMGSFLGSVDTNDAKLLDRTLCRGIRGTGPVCAAANNSFVSLDAVSWQGLMAGSTSLKALQQQLVADGFDVGTRDKLMNTDLTLAQLYTAYAEVLNNQGGIGKAQAAGPMGTLASEANGSNSVKLGQIYSLDQGAGDSALDTQVNAFQFVTGTAMAANGTNAIAVPDLGIAIPDTSKIGITLNAIQGPVPVMGKVGTTRTTQQADLTVTTTLNKTLPIVGLATAKLTGDFPFHITGGGAKGTMVDQNCSNAPGLTAGIDPQAFTSAVNANLKFDATTVSLPIVGSSTISATLPVTGSEVTNGAPGNALFAYTAEFLPNQVSKRIGSTTLGLNTVTLAAGSLNFTQGGGLIDSNLVVNTVMGGLPGISQNVDTLVVGRLSRLLGLNIGGADVTADWLKCNGQIGAIGTPFPVLQK